MIVSLPPDDNECAKATDNNCNRNAACTNTPGSFTCSCNRGYTGTGIDCTGKLEPFLLRVCLPKLHVDVISYKFAAFATYSVLSSMYGYRQILVSPADTAPLTVR